MKLFPLKLLNHNICNVFVVWLNVVICLCEGVRLVVHPFFDVSLPPPRMAFAVNDVYVSTERSGGHVDHFDIVERVEMGQMASMFFNKGNYSSGLELLISLAIIQLTADTTFILFFF